MADWGQFPPGRHKLVGGWGTGDWLPADTRDLSYLGKPGLWALPDPAPRPPQEDMPKGIVRGGPGWYHCDSRGSLVVRQEGTRGVFSR